MVIPFGKHRGESAEHVMLKDPQYVMWVLAQTPETGAFARLAREFRRLIDRFDSLPIVAVCDEPGCDRPATCGTLHRGQCVPYWWCPSCDPLSGGRSGKLVRVRTFSEACWYAVSNCNGRKPDMARLIRSIAEAKGLEVRVREAKASAFFQSDLGE